ncbi:hypothetical protein BLOT_012953, partial [Blomia tropicalis]
EQQVDHQSLLGFHQPTTNQHSRTSTWPLFIWITLSSINLATDHWDHSSTHDSSTQHSIHYNGRCFSFVAMGVVAFLMANHIKLLKQMAVALLMVNKFNNIELLKDMVVGSIFSNICGGAFDRRFHAI